MTFQGAYLILFVFSSLGMLGVDVCVDISLDSNPLHTHTDTKGLKESHHFSLNIPSCHKAVTKGQLHYPGFGGLLTHNFCTSDIVSPMKTLLRAYCYVKMESSTGRPAVSQRIYYTCPHYRWAQMT